MREEPARLAVELLEHLRQLPPDRAAARLDDVMRTLVEPSSQAVLDQSVVQALGDRRDGDDRLGRVSLAGLASLADRAIARLGAAGSPAPLATRRDGFALLDVLRRSAFLQRVADAGETTAWAARLLALVEASDFTFGQLFAQRAAAYGSRPLFRVPTATGSRAIAWHEVAGRVDRLACGLVSLGAATTRVAILSENRIEVALTDFACLAHGLVNVMIPATATDADVAYILGHARAGIAVVSSTDQLQKVLACRDRLADLRTIVTMDADAGGRPGAVRFDEVAALGADASGLDLAARRDAVRIGDLATIMYTSGTTGTPKGICFSHRNMVFKRFARALALPAIGEPDLLLSYLPLFHTFGRFLELQGSVFWGATYAFARSPAIDALAREMRELRPSVFISIPMKWMQLFDVIRQDVDVEAASDADITAAVRHVTGDRLRWGLSAAGYLDPAVFRFFQRHGIELMSGFGMTEATGGITMTPPGRYRDDSLGVALPGIEAGLGEGGELVVRGPYVMMGYLGGDGATVEAAGDPDGWFHTGDLMERDDEGYFRIIDRKKEIYKNVKGETIAPQKIENLFRDFESVGRVFLVGDQREFNTALIYPNPEFTEVDFSRLSPAERKAHFRSLVVTANSFLAPYERIVDFTVIDRDFDAARDELTPKGTYRRRTIERNFEDVIRLLYRRATLAVGGAQVLFPNWLFQALGVTAQDLRVDGSRIVLASVETPLEVERLTGEEVRVGSAVYRATGRSVDLGLLLSTPHLWLGNEQLVRFAPLDAEQRQGRQRGPVDIEWIRRAGPYDVAASDRAAAATLAATKTPDVMDMHLAALLAGADAPEDALAGLRLLETATGLEESRLAEAARRVLGRAAGSEAIVARRAFQVLAVAETAPRYGDTLARFLAAPARILDEETIGVLVERSLGAEALDAFVSEAETRGRDAVRSAQALDTIADLLALLASYGAAHPARYRRLRGVLTRLATFAASPDVRARALEAESRLTDGFRKWLGAPSRIAVDPETGLEYRWDDVVAFDDDVDQEARARIVAALKETPLLAEAAFLFSDRFTVRLADILPGGVWIRLLGADHSKAVYRAAVRTRVREQFDLAINLNQGLSAEAAQEEIRWLIVCAEDLDHGPLVEDFGGYWPAHGLWTEEFIPGDRLDRALTRLSRRPQDEERFTGVWPFAAWSALSTYVDFWNRTGRRLVVADPTPTNVIVPMHDYQTGARLVSIASRQPFTSLVAMLQSFRDQFVGSVEAEHPRLAGLAGWDVIFSAVFEVLGEEAGVAALGRLTAAPAAGTGVEMRTAAGAFLAAVERRGFLPRQLFFAAQRFRRWSRLNEQATLHARAATLQELYDTYGLARLHATYPETRARFYRETVFRDAGSALAERLEGLIARLRARTLPPESLGSAVSDLLAELPVTSDENYFLTRLSYPYLRPEDEAQLVATALGGARQSDMVVTVTDSEGSPFQIRHALNPREVGRLHRLFVAAKLPVQFRPEHRFLVAINERGSLAGGLFYELQPEARTAHMDKVVVAERFQRKGVAAALLEELCNRLRSAGYHSLTTGFFRPQFFYQHGFAVEGKYAGLVRTLADRETEAV